MGDYTTEPRFDADAALGLETEFEADEALRRGMRNGSHGKRSIVGLLRELTTEGRDLLSLEVDLAKAEMRENMQAYAKHGTVLAVGGGLLLAALMLAAWTLTMALTALLSLFLDAGVAVWLAPLILTVVFGMIGWSKVQAGLEAMSRDSLVPSKTIQTLKDDARWAERKVHS